MAMNPVRNENSVTLRDLGSELSVGANVAVDRTGKLLVTLTAGSTLANSAVIPEDQATASGQAMVVCGGVNNRNFVAQNSTQADGTIIGMGDFGTVFTSLVYDTGLADPRSAVVREDDPAVNAQCGIAPLGVRADSVSSVVNTNGDYTQFATDFSGCLIPGTWGSLAAQDATLAFGSVTTVYATLQTTSIRIRGVSILNLLDKPVMVSANATNGFGIIPANGVGYFDFATNNVSTTANISVKSIGGNATSGNIYITCYGAA